MNALARPGRILPDLTEAPVPAERLSRGRVDRDVLRRLFEAGQPDDSIAKHFGCCRITVLNHRLAMGLRRRKGRKGLRSPVMASAGASQPITPQEKLSRHAPKSLDDHVAKMPPFNHPALTEGRTIYPATVVPVHGLLNVLVSGENSWKIGSTITKGRWRGFPIYTLTLEERATCPTSCAHWRSCYGSSMHFAKRIAHGDAFEERLGFEVGLLSYRHPGGFAIRLHVLGDFYSPAYVDLWRAMLDRYPSLHVFGFTARIDDGDSIAARLRSLVNDHWPRFGVRFSNAAGAGPNTITIEHPVQKPADAIVCPQQLGKTASCATCALCWSTERRIAFVRH